MNDDPVPITAAELTAAPTMASALLDLNNEHAVELSWLEPDRLLHLVAEAALVLRIGNVDALLLAFDQDANYDSPNFLWFRSRFPHFIYVDRVVVAKSARGRGHARRLYNEVFKHAIAAGHSRVVSEVNFEPPNPASDAFHAALGFAEVGRAAIHGGVKSVRYLARQLAG